MYCGIPGCRFMSNSAVSVRMHQIKVHKLRHKNTMTDFSGTSVDCSSKCARRGSFYKHKHICPKVKTLSYMRDDCSMSDVEPDDTSMTSFVSGCSRKCDDITQKKSMYTVFCKRNRLILNKGKDEGDVVYGTEEQSSTEGCPVRKLKRYCKSREPVDKMTVRCDFPNCSYTAEKLKSVRIHKIRGHKQTTLLDANSDVKRTANSRNEFVVGLEAVNGNVEPDTSVYSCISSACPGLYLDSCSTTSSKNTAYRRSKRIAEKQTASCAENSSCCSPVKKGKYVCDVVDCNAFYYTLNDLFEHKSIRHYSRK